MELFIKELYSLLQSFGNVSDIILRKEIKQCSVHLNLNIDFERVLNLIKIYCRHYKVYYNIYFKNTHFTKCTFWYNVSCIFLVNLGF